VDIDEGRLSQVPMHETVPSANYLFYIEYIDRVIFVSIQVSLTLRIWICFIFYSVTLVRERTMPTERPPLVGEVVPTFADRGVAWSAQRIPTVVNLDFLDRSHYFFFQVAPQLPSRGWVDPVPDPLLFRKPGSAGSDVHAVGNMAFVCNSC
jgi:hypothetical protein